jgi:hypothetical protein
VSWARPCSVFGRWLEAGEVAVLLPSLETAMHRPCAVGKRIEYRAARRGKVGPAIGVAGAGRGYAAPDRRRSGSLPRKASARSLALGAQRS